MGKKILMAICLALIFTQLVQPPAFAGKKYKVTANVNHSRIILGQEVIITGKVSPKTKGQKVILQKRYKKRGKWINERSRKIKSDGTYVLRDVPTTLKTRWYRVLKPSSRGHRSDSSKVMRVKVLSWNGNVEASLYWDNVSDLDLHLVEPDRTEIYYGNPGPSFSGGQLDVDSNVGCGGPGAQENIYWPSYSAPTGRYYAKVVVYSDCGIVSPSWRLVLRVNGVVVGDVRGSGNSGWYAFGGSNGNWRISELADEPEFAGVPSPPKS